MSEHPERCLRLPKPGSSTREGGLRGTGSCGSPHTAHPAGGAGPAVAAGQGLLLSPQPQAGERPAGGQEAASLSVRAPYPACAGSQGGHLGTDHRAQGGACPVETSVSDL